MEIKQVVIHELKKASGTNDVDTNPATKPLNIESLLVEKLVIALDKLYGTRGNNAIYGTFSQKDVTNQFPKYTDQYLESESDERFLSLSIRCLDELAREAGALQSSTGGYIVLSRYKKGHEFLLIAMIKNKQGLNVNSSLEPEDITEIDLSKIHQAARINLTTYLTIKDAESEENSDEELSTYLSFVSPRSNHDVSGYFIKALDCTDGVPSSKATNTAFSTVAEYCKSKPDLRHFRSKAKDSLVDYFSTCLSNKEPATLTGVENSIRQAVPANKHELIDGFSEFANSEKYQLPKTFGVNVKSVKKYTRIKSKTEAWDLSFQRTALGTDENSQLYYNASTEKLIIQCSEDLKKQIEDELNSNNGNQ